MAAKKNPKVQLPKQWTTAQVRVNPQGKVQVKISANKVKETMYPWDTARGPKPTKYAEYVPPKRRKRKFKDWRTS